VQYLVSYAAENPPSDARPALNTARSVVLSICPSTCARSTEIICSLFPMLFCNPVRANRNEPGQETGGGNKRFVRTRVKFKLLSSRFVCELIRLSYLIQDRDVILMQP